jgi:hypothetical protein
MGRFRIPEAPASMIGDIKRSITGYKAGFGWDYSKPEQEGRVAMRPFVGTPKERLDGFRYYSSLLSCAPQSDITQRLLPLYRALDEEIATLPKSDVGSMQSRSFESYLRGFEKDAKTAQDFELKKGKD